MKNVPVLEDVQQPDIEDYHRMFSRMPCNTPNKNLIFKIITSPENILRALTVMEETGNSPIVVYKNKLEAAIRSGTLPPLSWHEKTFVGAVIRVVMEANKKTKTGKKQRFSGSMFKSAELYA